MELMDIEKEEMQEKIKKLVKKSEAKKRLIYIIVVTVMVLLTAVCALLYGQNIAKQKTENEIAELKKIIEDQRKEIQELNENPIVVSPIAPKIELDIVNSEIREIGELATVEYLFTDAAKFSDSKQIKDWNIPFTEKSFIMKWDGVIKAGVKVEQITVDVNEEEKKIIVSLPVAEILSYSINNDSVEVLDEKNNWINEITIDDKVKFDKETEEAMIERAIENGILEKAQNNAENIIANLLKANPAIGDDYAIEFVEAIG